MLHHSLDDLRRRTGIKWAHHDADVIPAWIADMDVVPAAFIGDEITSFLAAGDWGYVDPSLRHRLIDANRAWYLRHHGWATESEQSRVVLDVMQGVAAAMHSLTEPGDGVIVTTPIYHPFLFAINSSGRRLVEAPLTGADDGYRLTREALEAAVAAGGKVLLLCNPHNPTGRVFSIEELRIVAEVAIESGLIVISDEIHADLVYEPHRHVPIAALGSDIAARTITVTSPSKSFNLAGVGCAVASFGSEELLARFEALPTGIMSHAMATAVVASSAAWEQGHEWVDGLRTGLLLNRDTLAGWIASDRRIAMRVPEATYLGWLDFRPLGWSSEPDVRLLEKARVALSPGIQFGTGGAGHARLNFATSPVVLDEILRRMASAIEPTKIVI